MANYAVLKAAIEDVIKTNGNNEITGELMQESLIAIINSLGLGYQFASVATPATEPGTPDSNVMYIAGTGTYPNFGGTVVMRGSLGVYRYNGEWIYTVLDVASWADASNRLYYNTQAGDVAAKTIQADGFTLQPGGWLKIHFDNPNETTNPTLNVNNTGAHIMTFNGKPVSPTNTWRAGETVAFYYDNYMLGTWCGIRLFDYADYINVNELTNQDSPFSTKIAARVAVPAQNRKLGLTITYLLDDGWFTEQFIGTEFTYWSSLETNWQAVTTVGGVKKLVETNKYVQKNNLVIGGINSSDGLDYDNPQRVRTTEFVKGPFFASCASGYNIHQIYYYVLNSDGTLTYINYTGYTNTSELYVTDNHYCRLELVKSDESDFNDSDLPAINFLIHYNNPATLYGYIAKPTSATHGRFWDLSGTVVGEYPLEQTTTGFICTDLIPVNKGDKFILSTKGGASGRAYAFADKSRNILSVAPSNILYIDEVIEAPADGYLYTNCNINYQHIYRLNKSYTEDSISANLFGRGWNKLSGTFIQNGSITDYGELVSATGYYSYSYVAKKGCYYRIISHIPSNGAKASRAFGYLFFGTTKIQAVQGASPEYGDCDIIFYCDGSFDTIKAYGGTGYPVVLEMDKAIYDSNNLDNNMLRKPSSASPLPINTGASLVAMILNWGFIGASYISGAFEYKEDGVTKYWDNQYDFSSGQILMRINGTRGYNFSKGGETAKAWCTGNDNDRQWDGGNGKVATDLKQAYIVQLGSNDASTSITAGSLATDVNVSDYLQNADTFAGWIAGVIQRVLSVNPKAYFFLDTLRLAGRSDKRFAFSNIIKQLPAFFATNNISNRLYVLDVERYGMDWIAPGNVKWYNGTHPTMAGHWYEAVWLNTYIDKVIYDNLLDFNEIQFVDTDMSYNN